MIEIFNIPTRTYNNRGFTTNSQKIGDRLPISNFWKVLVRLEIVAIDPGETVNFSYEMRDSVGAYLGGSSFSFKAVGRYQFAFSRGDLNDNSTILVSAEVVGRIDLGATFYFLERGEDVLEWL